jgi:hypothetical protein
MERSIEFLLREKNALSLFRTEYQRPIKPNEPEIWPERRGSPNKLSGIAGVGGTTDFQATTLSYPLVCRFRIACEKYRKVPANFDRHGIFVASMGRIIDNNLRMSPPSVGKEVDRQAGFTAPDNHRG